MIKTYNRKELDKDLESGKRVYLFFQSLGCGPCKLVAPSIEDFAQDKDNVYVINSNEGKDLAQYLKVISYPTFIIIEDIQIIDHFSGTNKILTFLNTQGVYGTSNQ